MEEKSWLCPTELDRVRVVEAGERIKRARTIAAAACGIALLAAAPWVGWWLLGLFALAMVNLATLEPRLRRTDHPERVAAGTLLFMLGLFAIGAGFSGGPESPILSWLIIPAAMSTTRFRGRVVVGFGLLTAVAIVGLTFVAAPAATAADPVPVFVSLSLLACVSACCSALLGAELKHRDAAVLDPLTGLLNRSALESRVTELEQQAQMTGGSVCFIACDLDSFKEVNDTHGHDRGDVVLRAAAYEMRKSLRSFELIYRIGGEEFLVVLPGAGIGEGMDVAERLRAVVAQARPGGLDLTMSVGVSAAAGYEASYQALFKAADEALYRAKESGRNRVVAAPGPTPLRPRAALAGAPA